MKRSDLISYALNFVSFLVKKKPKICKVILFGSVARDQFDGDSDIDLFIDTNYSKDEIESILELYELSEDHKKYQLEGIKNKIRLKVGSLDDWKKIKRGIISDGVLLLGKYQELPESTKQFTLFSIVIGKKDRKDKVKLWRSLYGYRQKVGKKIYDSKGLVEKNDGRKLAPGIFMVPTERSSELISFLRKNKVNHTIKELFSD